MAKNKLEQVFETKTKDLLLQKTKRSYGEEPKCKTFGCKGNPLITDNATGEIICGSCGSILEEHSVDINPETTSGFEEFLAKTRTGPELSPSMDYHGMVTIMSDKDAMGNYLSNSAKDTFGRLKKLNSRSKVGSSSRTLRFALLFLSSLKSKLGLPGSVADNAAYIYRKAMQKKITVGRNARILMCASVYLSCRQNQIPRSISEVSQVCFITKKEVSRAYRILIENFDFDLDPCRSSNFVGKIASEARISGHSSRDALKIIQELNDKGLTDGKNPIVLASAALYLSCILNGECKSQAEISRASGITATSLKTRYASLKKELQIDKCAI